MHALLSVFSGEKHFCSRISIRVLILFLMCSVVASSSEKSLYFLIEIAGKRPRQYICFFFLLPGLVALNSGVFSQQSSKPYGCRCGWITVSRPSEKHRDAEDNWKSSLQAVFFFRTPCSPLNEDVCAAERSIYLFLLWRLNVHEGKTTTSCSFYTGRLVANQIKPHLHYQFKRCWSCLRWTLEWCRCSGPASKQPRWHVTDCRNLWQTTHRQWKRRLLEVSVFSLSITSVAFNFICVRFSAAGQVL